MLSSMYKKHFKDRFFNKILLTYTLIIIFSLTTLSLFILKDITSSIWNDAEQYNTSVVQSVSSYFELKREKVKTVIQQLYINHKAFSDVLNLLETDANLFSDEYLSMKMAMDSYLVSSISADDDISKITIVKAQSGDAYSQPNNPQDSIDMTLIDNYISANSQVTQKIIPSPINSSNRDNNRFSIITCIKSKDFSKIIGALFINFSDYSIHKAYSDLDKEFYNDVLVVTNEGYVIYDSSNRYSRKLSEYDPLTNSFNSSFHKDNIINTKVLNDLGITVASIVPKSQVLQSTKGIRSTIYSILAICILMALILSYMSITHISKRVKAINHAMNRVKSGNLSARISVAGNDDEINQIATNFNQMCDELTTYINEVYISGLKQKDAALKQRTAELYALQSQVNPHFLYNTLEAIRMRAVTTENKDVSTMIRILATLFRNSIKKGMVVKVRDELNYCKSYLELYNIRYEQSLEVIFDIDEDILDYGIIKLLLQPLIENSVVHGINMNQSNNIITVKGWKTGDNINFSITDNGNGIDEYTLSVLTKSLESTNPSESESIGIINANQRIKLIFGSNYGINIDSKKGAYTTLSVNIPAKTIEELNDNVQSIVS